MSDILTNYKIEKMLMDINQKVFDKLFETMSEVKVYYKLEERMGQRVWIRQESWKEKCVVFYINGSEILQLRGSTFNGWENETDYDREQLVNRISKQLLFFYKERYEGNEIDPYIKIIQNFNISIK
jgi:hypothetical protein